MSRPIALRADDDGKVYAYLCSTCRRVTYGGDTLVRLTDPSELAVKLAFEEADRCCRCTQCGAVLPDAPDQPAEPADLPGVCPARRPGRSCSARLTSGSKSWQITQARSTMAARTKLIRGELCTRRQRTIKEPISGEIMTDHTNGRYHYEWVNAQGECLEDEDDVRAERNERDHG